MRKVFAILILLITAILSGCAATADIPPSSPTTWACLAPVRYVSEAAFVQALKDGKIPKAFISKKLDYYFRPVYVPEGAVLKGVDVMYSYVAFIYSLGPSTAKDFDNMDMWYMWRKDYTNASESINYVRKNGDVIIALPNAREGFIYTSQKSYPDARKDLWGSYSFDWYQGNDCFGATVPWSIPEEDVANYFIMEKVMVDTGEVVPFTTPSPAIHVN